MGVRETLGLGPSRQNWEAPSLRHTRSHTVESGCVLSSGCRREGQVQPGQPYPISTSSLCTVF